MNPKQTSNLILPSSASQSRFCLVCFFFFFAFNSVPFVVGRNFDAVTPAHRESQQAAVFGKKIKTFLKKAAVIPPYTTCSAPNRMSVGVEQRISQIHPEAQKTGTFVHHVTENTSLNEPHLHPVDAHIRSSSSELKHFTVKTEVRAALKAEVWKRCHVNTTKTGLKGAVVTVILGWAFPAMFIFPFFFFKRAKSSMTRLSLSIQSTYFDL